MEYRVMKGEIPVCETILDTSAEQPIDLDFSLPDYCPDIARIIETDGKVYLHSRELRDGKAEVSGTVRVTVLYTPEAGR